MQSRIFRACSFTEHRRYVFNGTAFEIPACFTISLKDAPRYPFSENNRSAPWVAIWVRALPRVGVILAVGEVLPGQPLRFLVYLRDIDALDLEDDGPRAVVAAGDHHAVVVGPALHNGAALQRRIDVAAHRVPRLAAREVPAADEGTLTQVVEAVVFRCALKLEYLPRLEAGGTGRSVG